MNITQEQLEIMKIRLDHHKKTAKTVKPAKHIKYKGSEDELQIAVNNYLNSQYPEVLHFHVANERETQQRQNKNGRWYSPMGNKMKKKGVRRGVSDHFIIEPHWSMDSTTIKTYVGLVIELKVYPNKVSDDQAEFMEKMSKRGFDVFVGWDFETTKNKIDHYLKKL